MGRTKSAPSKMSNWNEAGSLDYVPKKRGRSKRKNSDSRHPGPFYNISLPSKKNEQFYLGQLCVGNTNNALPDGWKTCKMSFFTTDQRCKEHILIRLDETSVIVEILPENELLKEIIISKIFAIQVCILNSDVYFNLYFCDLPLPRFTTRLGLCIQSVLSLLLEVPVPCDEAENEADLSSNEAITQLYKNIQQVREKEIKLGCENVQNARLKPELRPYQVDAVRWMLYREQKSTDSKEDELHPLYTVIKLKSGVEIYYDKYSGYVDVTRPTIETWTKGGILADEMGLGKTVEVLACILQNPKHSELDDEKVDLDKSPTIKSSPRKRKIEEVQPSESLLDQSKKLKVPDDWVKSKSKKSQTYVALELWYHNVLGSATKRMEFRDGSCLQCICGGESKKGSVSCSECGKFQHAACLGYKKEFEPYKCPQCWMNEPLMESKATLIVTPVSLRTQWCKEICKHVKGDFKVLQYGGSSRTPVYPTDLKNYDVVITTYSVLQSELRLTENEKALSFRHQRRYSAPGSPISRVKWWRLCLDEAQTVETPTSMVSAMAQKLSAHFRWAVTGTPISKEISDLHGLINYLQMEPYDDKYTWETLLYNPYVKGQVHPLLKFLSQVLWRSSKDDVINQINIPKQTIEEHSLSFSAVEQYFYNCEHRISCGAFLDKARFYEPDIALSSMDKSALKIVLAPLLSLRQVCTYPNSIRTRYLATRKPLKSMKDLLNALIAKNNNECEEYLRVVLSALNGLAGVYVLLQSPEQAVDEYRQVLQLHARFTEEERLSKLSVDKLQVVHAMHNLAEILDVFAPKAKTLRDDSLRKNCTELEQKYIEKFINQSMAALQDSLLISANIEKLQNSFVLQPAAWFSDLLEWIFVHHYEQDLYTKIDNLSSSANVECSVDYRDARTLIYSISKWDENLSSLRSNTVQVVNDLYNHCPDDEFKIVITQELVQEATDCHLRPQKKSKNKNKCPVCVANEHLKTYELQLFSMSKRTVTFEEMSLKGSWKPTPHELILKACLAIGKLKNATSDLLKDGEIHINILELLKKEFKEVRRLWTFLDQQICAQDELDVCKIRLRLKEPKEGDKKQSKIIPILKNLSYNLENKLETIHHLDEHELEHQRIVLLNEQHRNMELLNKNMGMRSYLETLHTQQQGENHSPDPCPICKNTLEQHWSIVPCGHSYCLECIQLLIDQVKGAHMQCSVCRAYHSVTQISYIKTGEQNPEVDSEKIVGNYSTKVESIVRLILDLKAAETDVKILVFSSWNSVLRYLKDALVTNDIATELVAPGTLERQIEKFKDQKFHVTALLLPLNLGGKGLNLIEATHVILTEPLLNTGDELQAIGRVHRIGQSRPTVVHKFYIKNTIEESIQQAVSANAQNWEKQKVTIRQLMDLFVAHNAESTSQED